ncbi:MAG TPA: ATP-binding cassette domain-containing protein, partial [bacterium]|nr:ATP-binding cassette domain-containing protein [bacterium]
MLKEYEILHGISLNIPEGKTFVILGQSGSGKTVLLKTLLGLIQPYKGKLVIFGQDMFKIKDDNLFDIRRKTGMVFQSSALFDSMSVW